MPFASNNPFRPRATEMMPSRSAPSPFASKNPFLDGSSSSINSSPISSDFFGAAPAPLVSPVNTGSGGLSTRRASEDLPSLLVEFGDNSNNINNNRAVFASSTGSSSGIGHMVKSRPAPPPPPPPPPRSTARRVSESDSDPFADRSSSRSHRHASFAAGSSRSSQAQHQHHHRSQTANAPSSTVLPSSSNGTSGRHGRSHHHHTKSASPSSRQQNGTSSSSNNNSSSSGHKSKRSSSQKGPLDTIDRLDVTGIFGTGFHHDGPFDACNPHRNRIDKKAPMLAFPADSENNSLGAPAHLLAHRKGVSAAAATAVDGIVGDPVGSFDVTAKTNPVHGEVSLGLGSTTFFEGTPASRAAINSSSSNSKSHHDNTIDFSKAGGNGDQPPSSGLTRKRSIVQRLRSNSAGRDHYARPPPINTAYANTSAGSRHHSADDSRLPSAIMEEDGHDGLMPPPAPRMVRQVSSPASSTSATSAAAAASRSPTGDAPPLTLLKRVRSLKVGSSRRKE
ncbi:Pal1 cell morphology protein-domain-containing protein [Myxozyma melibiosi]|uniref:Pal1 cell morphology protein-domain-containing protein n=1 Tax=Myxozyma melibiosi TaxID=54550 RepID=A0ABR1FFE0_9ASCO